MWVNRPEGEANNSIQSSVEVYNGWKFNYTSPAYIRSLELRQR